MPEQLLAAVKELTDVVKKLDTTLVEYPKRHEVEERFSTKDESHARAYKFLLLGLVFVFMSFFASIIVTVGTVSTCFISTSARNGEATSACKLLPGYTDAQSDNQELIADFKILLEQPKLNSKRLDRIEKELGLPPFEGK